MKNWRAVPLPDRMSKLPRDKRGFPIFVIAFLDREGEPVFTMNDPHAQQRCIDHDLCMICGTKLFRGRWLVGGPMSAFDPNGVYMDGPMHHDCLDYAMRVCPYLATPNYSKDIAAKTGPRMSAQGYTTVSVGTLNGQPPVFVAVMCQRIDLLPQPFGIAPHFRPRRPYMRTAFWRGGQLISEEDAAPMITSYIERRKLETPTETVIMFGAAP